MIVNLIGYGIRLIERNADVLLNACKDIGLAISNRKTEYLEVGISNSYEKSLNI